ncbi:hypothetical protein [Nitrosomonas communis]|uniref:Uncharacterized protein n=1 Tax=Nitrosomonas communis TaxID=44574 RepID=A0A1I4U6X9_9PROT|nr:hypothetical protein [Nitrosomonas communis]SFM84728.1 hypothetical protein SAMN05421863_106014 [Nitrosomonas communis]
MINAGDLHSATCTRELKKENPKSAVATDAIAAIEAPPSTVPMLGRVVGQYSVTRYVDTRNLDALPSFLVTCLQRFVMYPQESFDFGKTPAAYNNYLAIMEVNLRPLVPEGTEIRLLDYWPRTLNAAVTTDISETGSNESNILRQHTSGSSTSTTNSFGVNLALTAGATPEGPSGSGTLGGNFEHSSTRGTSVEDTLGSSVSRGVQLTGAASMTIKDWASYATIIQPSDSKAPSLRWIWGQEYPWDLFLYRATEADNSVHLPKFLSDRLGDVDAGWVAPPSQLSMFGQDLIAHATWQVIPPENSIDPPILSFDLDGHIGLGSHSIGDPPPKSEAAAQQQKDAAPAKIVKASLNTLPYSIKPLASQSQVEPQEELEEKACALLDTPLDLELLALDAIGGPGTNNGAALGFSPDVIARRPVTPNGAIKMVSPTNTLALRGAGFLLPALDTPLKANVCAGGIATLNLFFKVADIEDEYSLIFKHWKADEAGCLLTIDINGLITVTRLVDDREGEGGSSNVTEIVLRSTDFTSIDYHDYLRLGLNQITIKITEAPPKHSDPDDPAPPCNYVLRALAVA